MGYHRCKSDNVKTRWRRSFTLAQLLKILDQVQSRWPWPRGQSTFSENLVKVITREPGAVGFWNWYHSYAYLAGWGVALAVLQSFSGQVTSSLHTEVPSSMCETLNCCSGGLEPAHFLFRWNQITKIRSKKKLMHLRGLVECDASMATPLEADLRCHHKCGSWVAPVSCTVFSLVSQAFLVVSCVFFSFSPLSVSQLTEWQHVSSILQM